MEEIRSQIEEIPFRSKIRKASGTFVVTIPSDYVNNGIMPEGEEMDFLALKKKTPKPE